MWNFIIFFSLAGFASGSVLYSMILPKWLRGIDIVFLSEDHNPGTANAVKYAGKTIGMLCLICDLGKGFAPVWLASHAMPPIIQSPAFALILAAPVLGHAFSPMLHGKGGKAIAVTFGVLLGILPLWIPLGILAVLYIFFSVVIVIHPHQIRTLWTFSLFALGTMLFCHILSISIGCLIIAAVVLYRHLPIRQVWRSASIALGHKKIVSLFEKKS